MYRTIFVFDLEKSQEVSPDLEEDIDWSVRYEICERSEEDGREAYAVIGDSFRHYKHIKPAYWNRLLKIIREDELNESGVDLILDCFLGDCFPRRGDNKGTFISAVKSGMIKPFDDIYL